MVRGCLGRKKDTLEIGSNHRIPACFIYFEYSLGDIYSGIINQNIQPAVFGNNPVYALADRSQACDVHLDRKRIQFTGNAPGFRRLAAGTDYSGTALGQGTANSRP